MHFGCINQGGYPVIIQKDINFKILLDSSNLYSELSFNAMFFHAINLSDENVILTFNNEKDTGSKKSLILITPTKDTMPIWYWNAAQDYYIFPPRSITYFTGMLERKKVIERKFSKNRKKGIDFFDYLEGMVRDSRIIYLHDNNKVMTKINNDLDTIVYPKSILDIEMKNNKFVWHDDTYTGDFDWELKTEKLNY